MKNNAQTIAKQASTSEESDKLNSSAFFNENNIFTTTERLILRKPIEEDMYEFMEAFATIIPGLARWYQSDERMLKSYWGNVDRDEALYCSICLKGDDRIIGYCSIDQLNDKPFELSICLKKEFHCQGFGGETTFAFMNTFESIAGPTDFIAKIEAENRQSQHMFRKLGFKPAGIDTFIIKDPENLKKFEDSRLDEIDDNIRTLAAEFEVEPRKLLSHFLVFKRVP